MSNTGGGQAIAASSDTVDQDGLDPERLAAVACPLTRAQLITRATHLRCTLPPRIATLRVQAFLEARTLVEGKPRYLWREIADACGISPRRIRQIMSGVRA